MDWSGVTDMITATCVGTFGIPVLYQPAGLSVLSIQAIFDEAYEAIDPQTGASIISTQPMIRVRLSDLPRSPGRGDQATIKGTLYRVNTFEPDGGGGARLLLQEIPA